MSNGRFPICMHILTLLAKTDDLLSSEYIAGSINANPALVRKEISSLRQMGLIETREGKNGGSMLAKPAKQIRLSEVYNMVRSSSLLGQSKNTPNPACLVGRQINSHLTELYDEVEQTLIKKLEKQTLESFANKFE